MLVGILEVTMTERKQKEIFILPLTSNETNRYAMLYVDFFVVLHPSQQSTGHVKMVN